MSYRERNREGSEDADKVQLKEGEERRGGGGRKSEIKGEIEIECDEEGEKKNGRE